MVKNDDRPYNTLEGGAYPKSQVIIWKFALKNRTKAGNICQGLFLSSASFPFSIITAPYKITSEKNFGWENS